MRSSRWRNGAWLLAALILTRAHGAGGPSSAAAAPLFALWHHDAATPLEHDSPQVVIYEDGTVIARPRLRADQATSARPGPAAFVTKRLPLVELNTWYDEIFAIIRDEELESFYDVDKSARAPTAVFHFQAGDRGVLVRVHGLSDAVLSPFGTLLKSDAQDVPARFLRVFQDARRLNVDGATAWKPSLVAVHVIPGPGPVPNARPWPAGWPNPDLTAPRSTGLVAALMLGATDAGIIRLAERPGWYPFRIGTEVRLAWFRPVFPSETIWRRQIEAEAEQARATLAATARQQLDAERGQMRDVLQQRVDAGTPRTESVPTIASEPRVQPPPIERPELKLEPFPLAPPLPEQKPR